MILWVGQIKLLHFSALSIILSKKWISQLPSDRFFWGTPWFTFYSKTVVFWLAADSQSKMIARRVGQILFDSEIFLGGLDRIVSQK